MKQTVMELMEDTAAKHGSQPALGYKKGDTYRTISWTEYRDQVRACARGFIKLGLQPKQGVSIIGFNCPEWTTADLAAVYAGGFPAGIYSTSTPEQCQYIAAHSDSAIVVVDGPEQLAKFQKVRSQLPKVKAIVVIQGKAEGKDGTSPAMPERGRDQNVYSWEQMLELGKSVPESELEARMKAQQPGDACTLIYTSGTTGDPKAVIISHDNITFVAEQLRELVAFDRESFLSYLPLSHIAEQIVSIYGPMACAGCTYFAESMEKLPENLREVRPTIFLGVPRVWEKIQSKMVEAGAKNTGLKKKIATWARQQGMAGGYADQNGQPRPLLYPLAKKLVFDKVRVALGLDRCRIAITSAAPISKATLEFFLSLGIPIMEVFGMSECTGPATFSLAEKYKTGMVGRTFPETEIKIAEDGEICMRGRHVFQGYYKNKEATAEALDSEGWLHSGDIGEFDRDGYLKITDRKKDLLITAGGENIAPQVLEGKLRDIAVIAHAVVVGDRQKHLAALLTIDSTKLGEATQRAGSKAKDLAEAAECEKLHGWLMDQVNAINRDLARVQTIKKIRILPSELTIEGGELTPTMKIKRKVIYKKYEKEIKSFYDDASV